MICDFDSTVLFCFVFLSPVKQWMYYDAVEALPDKPLAKEEVQPIGCRYDGSIMVFGKAMQVTYIYEEGGLSLMTVFGC